MQKTPDEIKKALRYHFLHAGCAGCCYKELKNKCQTTLFADIREYIQQLEREKEALLTDLRATDPCDNCKHCGTAWECDGDCSFCYHSETCQCRECDNDSHWEWAGIKEDNQ